MIGEGVGANDLLKSFLWNMLAFWEEEDYKGRIRELYRKRNDLIHQGRRDRITHEDLAFTDHLLVNLLANLVNLPIFNSKDAVIDFSKKLEAERILGVKPRVRPKDLRFVTSEVRIQDPATGESMAPSDAAYVGCRLSWIDASTVRTTLRGRPQKPSLPHSGTRQASRP
jgi:hypothetical protein